MIPLFNKKGSNLESNGLVYAMLVVPWTMSKTFLVLRIFLHWLIYVIPYYIVKGVNWFIEAYQFNYVAYTWCIASVICSSMNVNCIGNKIAALWWNIIYASFFILIYIFVIIYSFLSFIASKNILTYRTVQL